MALLPGRMRCGPYKLPCLVAAPSHGASSGPHKMRPLQIAVLCPEVRGAVESTPMKPLELVKQYHEQTKHEFNRYARALGYMDWANQPDPFRRYEGTPLYELPLLAAGDEPVAPSYELLFSSQPVPPQPLTLNSLSRFFEYGLSITAWKEYGGNRWALRSNPSSGNLHPTEGYLLIRETADLPLKPGLYHYAAKEHGLEHRGHGTNEAIEALLQPFPAQSFFVGLSSIHWREAWKYGERAFRYCQHDVGHALGTLRIAGAVLGWRVFLLAGLDDRTIGALLGLNRLHEFEQAEPELPELLCVVCPIHDSPPESLLIPIDQTVLEHWEQGDWRGKANRLSRDNPVPWEIIDEVTKASWKTSTEQTRWDATVGVPYKSAPIPERDREERASLPDSRPDMISAHQIIHQRRSAVAFDGTTSISAQQFFTMLERVMPHPDRPVPSGPCRGIRSRGILPSTWLFSCIESTASCPGSTCSCETPTRLSRPPSTSHA